MPPDRASLLHRAKDRLGITALWRLRGWPHEPGKECFCPYRPEDSRESFSVFVGDSGAELAHDFKTGSTFDAPGLLGAVEGLSNSEACKLFMEIALGPEATPTPAPAPAPAPRSRQVAPAPARRKPSLPALTVPTMAQVERIAELRHVSPESVAYAVARGFIFTVNFRGLECWAVTDSARWNCQFRRLNGKHFPHAKGPKKTLGAVGTWAGWPIGAADLGASETVLLVEGSGDFLAAWHFITAEKLQGHCAAICVTGASNWLPGEALQAIGKRRTRIFPHVGDTTLAGEQAGLRWETQIATAGGSAHCFDLAGLKTTTGDAVGDLNDVLKMAPQEIQKLLPICP